MHGVDPGRLHVLTRKARQPHVEQEPDKKALLSSGMVVSVSNAAAQPSACLMPGSSGSG